MSRAVEITVPEEQIGSIFKAAESHIHEEHEGESEPKRNPAEEHLAHEVSLTYDAMAFSMLKEIFEVLSE